MELTTVVPLESQEKKINLDSKIFSIGSCFAENMAERLQYHQFRTLNNPTGILFHPTAIRKFFELVANERKVTDQDFIHHNGQWHYFDGHSQMSRKEKTDLENDIASAVSLTRQFLSDATHIIITLGTAWAYRLKSSGSVVANCHKVSQKEFEKLLFSPSEIKNDLAVIKQLIQKVNPDCQLIFSVSPVRHIKDGFVGNQRSKSHLISGLHDFLDQTDASATYFPAYEILMDELRDYRFYADDLLHPSDVAVEYIWRKFTSVWMSEETQVIMKEIDGIRKSLAHRPFDKDSDAYRKHLSQTESRISALQQKFPFVSF